MQFIRNVFSSSKNTKQITIGNYTVKVKKQIAEGGFSFIFLCQDSKTNLQYVLKEMRVQQGNEEMMKAAKKDLEMMKTIPLHSQIVQCYATAVNKGDGPNIHYHILMEHCDGGSVFDFIQSRHPAKLSEREVGKIFHDVLSAVVHLHSQSPPIAHRDLKVENVLHDTVHNTYKLCDFGSCTTKIIDCRNDLSKSQRHIVEENISKNTTLAYRAPEMVDLYQKKLINEKVDVWSLGCLLYMLCFNRTPFEDYSGQVSRMGILSGRYTIPLHHRYSKGLIALMVRCLEPNPDIRPSSFQVLKSLDKLLGETTFDHVANNNGGYIATDDNGTKSPDNDNNPSNSNDIDYDKSNNFNDNSIGTASNQIENNMLNLTSEDNKDDADNWASFSAFQDVDNGEKNSNSPNSKLQRDLTHVNNNNVSINAVKMGNEEGQTNSSNTHNSNNNDGIGSNTGKNTTDPLNNWFANNNNNGNNDDNNSNGKTRNKMRSKSTSDSVKRQASLPNKFQGRITSTSIDIQSAKVKGILGETMQAGVYRMMGQKKKKLLWVLRVTSSKPGAPKPKYLRQLVIDAWEVGALTAFQTHITSRPIYTQPIVALKGCIVWLKLLQQGPPEISLESYKDIGLIETMVEAWARISAGGPLEGGETAKPPPLLAILIHRVAVLISQKLYFHHENSQFDSHYVVQTGTARAGSHQANYDIGWEGEVNVVSRLLTMLSTIDQLQQMASGRFGKEKSQAAKDASNTAKPLLLPLVQEAWSAYSGLTNVLGNLRQRILNDERHEGQDVFQALMYQYFEQREALREFLEKARKEPEVSKFHTVPIMKSIPPVVALGNILSPKYMFGIEGNEDENSNTADTTSDIKASTTNKPDDNINVTPTLNEGTVSNNDHENSWADFMSGKSDDWSSIIDETATHKMLSSREGRDHLKNAVFAAFKEHDDENSDNDDEAEDPFGINDVLCNNNGGNSNVLDAEVDFAIFDSPIKQTQHTNPFNSTESDAWAPVSFGSNNNDTKSANKSNPTGHARINSDSDGFFDQFQSQSLIESFANFDNDSKNDNADDADAFSTDVNHTGLFDSANGKAALTPSERRPLSNSSTKSNSNNYNTSNPFDMFDNSDAFKAYSNNNVIADERPPSLGSRGSYRSNSNAEDAIRRSEIALARLIENVQLSGIEIQFSAIKPGRRVGAGAFAVVYEGKYRGQSVAVKHLQLANINEKVILDFHTEVAMIKSLRHPNIVHAMGACIDPICLVTEFCTRGSLFDLLQKKKLKLTWELRLKLAIDAARGMRFLHTHKPTIIHRDLKSLNLLVDEQWTLKVTDFGLSRFKSPQLMTGQCGTFQWMAPEVVASQSYTEKADVYSFGINLWELWTRKVPYGKLQPMQVAVAVMSKGKRPDVPDDMPSEYRSLMESCWQQRPEKRPPFTEIMLRLNEIAMKHKEERKAETQVQQKKENHNLQDEKKGSESNDLLIF